MSTVGTKKTMMRRGEVLWKLTVADRSPSRAWLVCTTVLQLHAHVGVLVPRLCNKRRRERRRWEITTSPPKKKEGGTDRQPSAGPLPLELVI